MRTAGWTDSVSVLDRVAAVLEAFGDDDGLGVSEIARRANLPKSTVSRIVTDLVRERYLDREGTTIHLGIKVFELGQAVERPRALRRIARPVMSRLHTMTGESVDLAVLDDTDIVVIATLAGRSAPNPDAGVGVRTPARASAMGWAVLAHTSDDRLRGFPGSPDLQARLAEVRRAGVATDETCRPAGTVCVASAILVGAEPIGVVAVSGPPGAIDARRVGGLVRAAASAIGRQWDQRLP